MARRDRRPTTVQRASGTVLLILPASQDMTATVAALCAAETGCCPQTRFVLEISDGQLVLSAQAPATPGLLDMLFPPATPARP